MDSMLASLLMLSTGAIFGFAGSILARRIYNRLKPSKRLFTLDLPIVKRLRLLNIELTYSLPEIKNGLKIVKMPGHGFPDQDFDLISNQLGFTHIKCKHCGHMVGLVVSHDARIHPHKLGLFCPECGSGRLIRMANRNRADLELPRLGSGNLHKILKTFERDAIARGILKEPVAEEPAKPRSFIADVDGTGSLRQPPMRVRVDPTNQTVRPVEDETQVTEAELADHQASEAAKKTLPN